MELTTEIMYKAILEKDTSFEGVFFTAVKTTGIFCRPSCTARKPKLENIEFLKTSKECMTKGYRACKVCKPLDTLNHTPKEFQEILDELSENPTLKFKDYDLKQRGIEPSQIRRWFLKNHNITFHAYQRMFRINSAFKKIKNGESITHAAFDSGFESLSGFGDSFKNIFGVSPKKGNQQTIIDLKRIETPLGTMLACATNTGICLLEFTDRRMLETSLKSISKKLKATIVQGNNQHFDLLESQLQEYFNGERKEFTVPLHIIGTEFQNKVWSVLMDIPYGETKAYQEQAISIGNPKSVRAVANANGMNTISILIPCHRVIGSDGDLKGYGGGLWRKKYLLDFEKKSYKFNN
ncbi:AraC family transcriptional regulator, regulatory protein of adaptative response / methylated-DNA-[protein]-cysteine methyltransferase [Chishuiella changwenlii]|uniref:methylated-DNA--[protein]-cysteine S-methyltransferase n=1 Tax=Chishuiella changwenlii TaxID=1434701 RepID=A0A1M7C4F6_9FLAO|nr:bifunctional transcriptional activator/DNA repair protein Ada [Chishuiella changwenlii]GGF05665.1 XRE family transcriptional regulator [Chishuiella changwenlii]SHL62091.1 AraC family transcriptional regulator, regulatory protein of adaptative response / methylated-DNA-[protein]-cysteine methyltransferase [Chishuiella changwenlii]